MASIEKPIANPMVILREEYDDWAVLFDPDTCKGFGLSPVGVYIWKLLDGKHSSGDIVEKLRKDCEGMPEDAESYVDKYLDQLVENALAGASNPA